MIITRPPAWIARYCDPSGINDRYRPRPYLRPGEAAINDLVRQTSEHNVLLACARNIEQAAKTAPHTLVVSGADSQHLRALRSAFRDMFLALVSRNILLARTTRLLQAKIRGAGLPAVAIKGLDFAEECYGGLPARAFSDVDLLVAPDAAGDLAKIVTGMGFEMVTPSEKRESYTERQFIRTDERGELELVEIHTDLVHAPKLRARMSLDYSAYAGEQVGGLTMASRLILAAVHGAASHLFDRAQYVVDVLMVARSGVDPYELVERCEATGTAPAVRTGLRLASAMFRTPECEHLLTVLPRGEGGFMADHLISPASVLDSRNSLRGMYSWRRQLYRKQLSLEVD